MPTRPMEGPLQLKEAGSPCSNAAPLHITIKLSKSPPLSTASLKSSTDAPAAARSIYGNDMSHISLKGLYTKTTLALSTSLV